MILETIGRDCLFLNWAIPLEALPRPEPPLRYDVLEWQGGKYVFVSAALFRQQVLKFPKVHFPAVSYPQLSVRLCAVDGDRLPSFYVCSLLLPAWVLPSIKLIARQSARRATFDYPPQGVGLEAGPLRWRIKSKGRLDVEVSEGAMAIGEGPPLGAWKNAVHYFQQRKRWYLKTADGLRRIDVTSNAVQAIPVAAEVADATLLRSCLSAGGRAEWPRLHSCWLSPEVPFVFEVGRAKEPALPVSLPAPG